MHEVVRESYKKRHARAQSRVSSKFPDDPTIRVELAESFRQDLGQHRRAAVAKKVLSPGGERVLHRTSISRYIKGTVSPTLGVARRLAAAAGRPLAEAVAGYSARYGKSTERWTKEMFYARPFRTRVFAFLEMFGNVLPHVHFGFPTDAERRCRRVVNPKRDRMGWGYFEIACDEPLTESVPFDFIVSYQLFEKPPVFIDYGKITVTAEEVRGEEMWTRRAQKERLGTPNPRLCVQTWLDGKAVDFVLRSSRPFTLGPVLAADELPAGPLTVVRFEPGGIHRHAAPGGAGCAEGAG